MLHAISSGRTIKNQTAHESDDQNPNNTRSTRYSCVSSRVRVLRPADVLFVLQSALIRLVLVSSSCSKRPFPYYFSSIRVVFLLSSCGARVRFVWISSFVKSSCRQQVDDLYSYRTTFVYFVSMSCGNRVAVVCRVGSK